MLESIKSLGTSGVIGALLGVALVLWIEPTTNGGIGLIIVVSILLCLAVGGAVTALRGKK